MQLFEDVTWVQFFTSVVSIFNVGIDSVIPQACILCTKTRDAAPIRHWFGRLPITTKKLICCLISVIYLGSNSRIVIR